MALKTLRDEDQLKLIQDGFFLIRLNEKECCIECRSPNNHDWHRVEWYVEYRSMRRLKKRKTDLLQNSKIIDIDPEICPEGTILSESDQEKLIKAGFFLIRRGTGASWKAIWARSMNNQNWHVLEFFWGSSIRNRHGRDSINLRIHRILENPKIIYIGDNYGIEPENRDRTVRDLADRTL